MGNVRKPAVAGSFYPADPEKLRRTVQELLAAAHSESPVPKAIIVPHAGYIYSGPIAASAYAPLIWVEERPHPIQRVVLLGPAHYTAFDGLAASSADAFETPLGPVPIDTPSIKRIQDLPQVQLIDLAHRKEHSLEVQLPFLQEVLGSFLLVPLAVGFSPSEDVADVMDALWEAQGTIIVVSSDLSHYYDYDTARRLDAATSQAIEALQPEKISPEQACGSYVISGLLTLARRRGWTARTTDLRNSGDTAGDRESVVGYGAFLFT